MKKLIMILMVSLLLFSCNDKDLIDDIPVGVEPLIVNGDAMLQMIGKHQDSLIYRFGYADVKKDLPTEKEWSYRSDLFKEIGGRTEYLRNYATFEIDGNHIVSGIRFTDFKTLPFYDPNAEHTEQGVLYKHVVGKHLTTLQKMYAGVDGFSTTNSTMEPGSGLLIYNVITPTVTRYDFKVEKKKHVFHHLNGVVINCWIEIE